MAWAAAYRLDRAGLPAATRGDLFDFDAGDPTGRTGGSRRRPAGWSAPTATSTPTPARRTGAPTTTRCSSPGAAPPWTVRGAQEAALGSGRAPVGGGRPLRVGGGLPVRRARPRRPARRPRHRRADDRRGRRRRAPTSDADARRIRAERDQAVLAHTPGRESTDLRNPLQVKELLASVGVVVPNTRKWVLEPFRDTHPVVGGPAGVAQGRTHRHHLRLPLARRPRRAPTTGCAAGGRRATAPPGG